jgi:hypothetical protein
MRIRTLAAALLAMMALTLGLASPAMAKLPPSGKYGCVLASANQYLGDLIIRGERYRINRSRWGTLVDKGGRRIKFKSGAWKGLFRGFWERVDSVLQSGKKITEIELTEVESGYQSSYCTKEA